MLKITLHDSPEAITFELEGKLVGAYARELEQCWLTASSVRGNKTLTVDVRNVDFIDADGRRVLSVLHEAGAQFRSRGPLTSAVIQEVTGSEPESASERDRKRQRVTVNLTRLAWVLGLLASSLPLLGQNPPGLPQTPQPEQTGTPVRLTLRDAVQTALKQNPQVAIANLAIAQAQQNAIINRASLLPQANLAVSEALRRVNIQANIGLNLPGFPKHVGPFWVFQGGPNFSIPLLDLNSFRRWQASRENVTAARAQEVSAREENVQLVVSQYLGALRAGADVAAAHSRMDVAKALLDLATDLQKNGAGTRIDTVRADVQYQTERQRLITAETEQKTALYGLARLLNIDPRTPVELSDQGTFFETPVYEGGATVESAFQNRPELRASESQIRSLQLQRQAASAQRVPRLSVTGGWSETGLTPATAIPSYNYQANLEVPLFTGGRIRAEQALADIDIHRVEQEQQDLRNRISLEVQTALAQLNAARSQVDLANHALELAREELTQARDRFQAGVANNIEVIQAQDEVSRANENQIQALYQYNQSRADLARATGQIQRVYTR